MAAILALVAAAFVALLLRPRGLVVTILTGYLVFVTLAASSTWLLSPFHALNGRNLLIVEALVAASAGALWARRRPPLPDARAARGALVTVARDPATGLFVLAVIAALGYELLLAVTAPPTNWDSLTYHLARVLAWHQQHAVSWIPNAPTGRMNEFQPLAEQQILFLYTAIGSTAVFALPQLLAELAILVATYGSARRLGFDERRSAAGAALLATFSLIALEATTEQNDLVAASFPAVALLLLLEGGAVCELLAGTAVVLGAAAKLTTLLVLPVLAWVAWSSQRRRIRLQTAGAVLGLVLAAGWGFVLNQIHTGNPLGHGQGRTEHAASLSVGGTFSTAGHVLARLADVSVLGYWSIAILAGCGAALAAGVALRYRHERPASVALAAAAAGLPLLAPAIALAAIHVLSDPAWVTRAASQDYSSLGPVGGVAIVAAIVAAVVVARGDRRQMALAVALPLFALLLGLYAAYDVWISRFVVVPAAIAAPLLARLFRDRLATSALATAAVFTVALTLTHDNSKQLAGKNGRPWSLDQISAIGEGPALHTAAAVSATLRRYERLVPARACVAAVMDPDDFSYLLWQPALDRTVRFLPSVDALQAAVAARAGYVVISNGANAPVAKQFTDGRWTVEPLGSWWLLAVAPRASGGDCG